MANPCSVVDKGEDTAASDGGPITGNAGKIECIPEVDAIIFEPDTPASLTEPADTSELAGTQGSTSPQGSGVIPVGTDDTGGINDESDDSDESEFFDSFDCFCI